jgi:hypothetical protein
MIGDALLEARIARLLLAGARVISLRTTEEARALAVAEAVAEELGWPLHTWSIASGTDHSGRERELGGVLVRLRESEGPALWLLFDGGRELRSSAHRRLLRELAQARGAALVLVETELGALAEIPELEHLELPLPDHDLLRERVRWIAAELEDDRPRLAAELVDAVDRLATAGLGLELERFDRVIAEAALAPTPTASSVAAAVQARRVADAARAGLEQVATLATAELAGFERYLEHLRSAALSFDPAAARAGIRPARGVALIGRSGTGKAHAVRVGAGMLGLELLRLDPTTVAGPDDLHARLVAVERAAPVALWIPDLDGRRELVEALERRRWPRTASVFTFVTGTRGEPLPSLDQRFFVDLPGPELRAAILAKLLGKAALADPPARYGELARAATGCSAAELEAALTLARLRCFARGRPLAAAEFEAALAERPPAPHDATPEHLRRWPSPHAPSPHARTNTAIDST